LYLSIRQIRVKKISSKKSSSQQKKQSCKDFSKDKFSSEIISKPKDLLKTEEKTKKYIFH
jgi:hypothetical protein